MTVLTLENTGIVIDSTCDPLPHFVGMPNVAMVPLKVLFGDEAYDDGIELTIDQFYEKLATATVMPTTSQPSSARFAECYAEMCERYEHVLSVHISAGLSGTLQSASIAAEQFPRVEVYDSKSVAGGLGLLVQRLHDRLQEGIEADEARRYIAHYQEHGRLVIHAVSLEHLRRGGRIGRAQSMVAGMLGIHPVLQVEDGVVAAYGKARGHRRAVDLMMQYLHENAPSAQPLYVALMHGAAPEALEELRQHILAARPDAHLVLSGSIGSVVGVHIGPGPSAFAMISE
jgi:DegV family protein with EDD domain